MSDYTDRERELLDSWPTVTAEDLTRMNDLFPHYLFFRKEGDLMGLGGVRLYTSCCGYKGVSRIFFEICKPSCRKLLVLSIDGSEGCIA